MGKEPENIEEFKKMVGRILGALYSQHPKPIFFSAEAFLGEDVTDEEEEVFDDTLLYLVTNAYVNHVDGKSHIQLSAKSWEILSEPNPLEKKRTMGATLAEWVKGTTSDTGKEIAKETVMVALKSVATAVGMLVAA